MFPATVDRNNSLVPRNELDRCAEYFGVRDVTRQLPELVLGLRKVASDRTGFAAGPFLNRASLAAETLFLRKHGEGFRIVAEVGLEGIGAPRLDHEHFETSP